MRVWICLLLISMLAARARGEMPLEKEVAPTRTIPLPRIEGRIDHMALDVANGRMLMAAQGSNSIMVVDLKLGKASKIIAGVRKPQGIAVSPELDRFVVTSETNGSCRLFESQALKSLGEAGLQNDADNVRYEASTRRFWIGYGRGGIISLNPENGDKGTDIKLDGHPESFQLESNGKRIFVNVPMAGHIAVVDREKAAVLSRWKPDGVGGFFPMALDEAHHRLFIGCRKPAMLAILDTETGKTIASNECVPECDDLFYDETAKQIYISGEGYISVFRVKGPDQYELTANIPTAEGARTSLFDPETGLLYVAVPHRDQQKAELRVYELREKS